MRPTATARERLHQHLPVLKQQYRVRRAGHSPGWPASVEELDRMDWRQQALCREQDPELFFPIGTTGPAAVQVDEAKAVCGRCPSVEPCLVWAIDTGQDAGVWGGTSEDERRALTRRSVTARVRTA